VRRRRCPPARRSEPPLTTKTASFAGCLDYVWTTPQHVEVRAGRGRIGCWPALCIAFRLLRCSPGRFSPRRNAAAPGGRAQRRQRGLSACPDRTALSGAQVVDTLAMPYPPGGVEPQQVQMPPIPNAQWPSDHLAVGCDLRLTPAARRRRRLSNEQA
jgi:CCR4-NOT transcription complex subunit 6